MGPEGDRGGNCDVHYVVVVVVVCVSLFVWFMGFENFLGEGSRV